ncbi:MAG: YceI family protein [Rickettsiales bacterium]|nr:YceI family protein [Rickettsiales bacterium]
MFRSFMLGAFVAAMPAAALAQTTPLSEMPSGTYSIDPAHTSVTWRVSHLGLSNYTARFAKVSGTMDFDPADPTKSTLKVSVDPLSVKTDYPDAATKDFDKELATGKDWFNGTEFRAITFTSTQIVKTGANTGDITGDLTFLGVTKPLVLHATFNGAYSKKPFMDTPGMGFSATGTLKRSEWGMTTYIPNLGDEVQLVIETEFDKGAP